MNGTRSTRERAGAQGLHGRLSRWAPAATAAVLLGGAIFGAALPVAGLADDDNDNSNSKPNKEKPEITQPTTQQGITPADARPDLEITFAGFNAPGINDQLIKFLVTNRGNGPSVATVARVVTSRPEPTPWFRELDVKALAPGESAEIFYPLAASCNGHLVRALVNVPGDSNATNNFLEWEVCPPPIIVQNPPDLPPAHLRSGRHAPALTPVAARTFAHGRTLGDCSNIDRELRDQARQPLFPLVAGFQNIAVEHVLATDCQANGIWQAAFRFDLSQVREAWSTRRAAIVGADLTFTETPYAPLIGPQPPVTFGYWNPPGPSRTYVQTNTCWPRLARPTVDWNGRPNDLIPNEVLRDPGEIGRWNLLDEMGRMLTFPELEVQGFVILGHNEEMHFNDATCQSKIDDVKLTVTYVVPEQ